MRIPHIVPMFRQTIAILKQIKDIPGDYGLVFPCASNPYKPMCENRVNKALRLMGDAPEKPGWTEAKG